MAFFRMPNEDRKPEPGEYGEIILIDLQEGEQTVVAKTYGFEQQYGVNIN